MTTLTLDEAQGLIGRVVKLAAEAARGSEAAREVARALSADLGSVLTTLQADSDGKLPKDAWEQLPESGRVEIQTRLGRILNALVTTVASADEPREPTNFMFRAHATNPWIHGLVLAAIAVVFVLLWGLYRYWDAATAKTASEAQIVRMVILMGALGGAIHWMSSLVNYIGNGNLFRRWIPYYLLAPFQGAALAIVVYLLLRVGVLANPAGNAAEHLNLLGLYAFAGLTGLFAKQAIEMLRDVFSVIFKRIDAKDAASARRPRAAAEHAGAAGAKAGTTP
jgi:hypothetical protein